MVIALKYQIMHEINVVPQSYFVRRELDEVLKQIKKKNNVLISSFEYIADLQANIGDSISCTNLSISIKNSTVTSKSEL